MLSISDLIKDNSPVRSKENHLVAAGSPSRPLPRSPLRTVQNGAQVTVSPDELLQSTLKTLSAAQLLVELRTIYAKFPQAKNLLQESLLVKGKDIIRYHVDSDSEDESEGSETEEDQRYVKCLNCDEEFDVTDNEKGYCTWHTGVRSIEYDSSVWDDHDENCHGAYEDFADDSDYTEGFHGNVVVGSVMMWVANGGSIKQRPIESPKAPILGARTAGRGSMRERRMARIVFGTLVIHHLLENGSELTIVGMKEVIPNSEVFADFSKHRRPEDYVSDLKYASGFRWSSEDAQDIANKGREAHVVAITRSPWFRRLWIIQEILLEREATILYSKHSISWTTFARALRLFKEAMTTTKSQVVIAPTEIEDLERVFTILNTRAEFRLWASPSAFVAEPFSGSFTLGIYEKFRNQQCYDDRDRVFGFLALRGPEHILDFVPDYRWNLGKTYKEFALSLLRVEGGCRHLLDHAGIWHRNEDQSTEQDISSPNYLPSWVPDFRPITTSSRLPATLRSRSFRTASNITGITDYARIDQNILTVRGKIFDDILCLGICGPDFAATGTLTIQLLAYYNTLKLEEYPAGGNAIHAFLKIMTMGDDIVSIEKLLRLWEGFSEVIFGGDNAEEHDAANLQCFDRMHNCMVADLEGDSCIVTKRGFFGRVPFATLLGDRIAVIAGMDTPVVVRWAEEKDACLLVGTCYIQGLMVGGDDDLAGRYMEDWISLA